MKKQRISDAVIHRLPRYYRYLDDLHNKGVVRISSNSLGSRMDITASQIRQDLSCFGEFGQQGYGYNVRYLFEKISDILGVNECYNAVIIGAGNLGSALAGASAFNSRGVFLKALFDVNPSVIGKEINGLTVYDWKDFDKFVRSNKVDIAVITVPKSEAISVAKVVVSQGVGGIWNFTGVELKIPDIPVKNVHMGDILMTLCYEMRMNKSENT